MYFIRVDGFFRFFSGNKERISPAKEKKMDTKEQQVKRGIQSAKAEIDRRMAELLPKVMPNIIEQTKDADEPEKVRRVVLLKNCWNEFANKRCKK